MESRKITIVSTKTQKKSVIMSEAETLGQLKADLDAAGIDYENMTFYEGTSKTELKSDESVLPTNVPYTKRSTGETIITNELVFMLTNVNKKIASGTMSRVEIYNEIRNNNLEVAIKQAFGRNFTQVSTAELVNFLGSHLNNAVNETKSAETEPAKVQNDSPVAKALDILVEALYYDDVISYDTYDRVKTIIGKIKANEVETKEGLKSSYDDEDIEAMMADIL
jgi:hypothetical protein